MKNRQSFKHFCHFLLAISVAVVTSAFTVSLSVEKAGVQVDVGRISGHEEITRQAMNLALYEFEARGLKDRVMDVLRAEMTELSPEWTGLKGGEAKNPVIRGNFATDVPQMKPFDWEVDLKRYYSIPDHVDWHTNANGQTIHFLRNPLIPAGELSKEGDRLQSAREACVDGREKIVNATIQGYEYWKRYLETEKELENASGYFEKRRLSKQAEGFRRQALFMFGHASHILQDSFSPAHVLRSEYGNNDIKDICFYDPREAVKQIKEDALHNAKENSHVKAGWELLFYENNDEDIPVIEAATIAAENRRWEGKVCMHSTFDLRDGIWIRTNLQYELTKNFGWGELEKEYWEKYNKYRVITAFEPVKKCRGNWMATDGGKHQCLKHEARLARTATARYFTVLVDFMLQARNNFNANNKHTPVSFLRERLRANLFEGNNNEQTMNMRDIMPDGVMRCERLSNEVGVIEY